MARIRGAGRRSGSIRLDKGWEKYNNATDVKKFKRKFARERKKAIDALAKDLVRDAISPKLLSKFSKNATLTQAIKGGRTPLKDTGKKLVRAVSTRSVNVNETFVGVQRSSNFFKTAAFLTTGGTFRVTPKMRMMFNALSAVSRGEASASILRGRAKELYRQHQGPWYPLKTSTTKIKVPGRDFMGEALGSDEAKAAALKRFMKAADRVLHRMARG